MINQIAENVDNALKPVEMGAEIVKLSLAKKKIEERLQVLRDQLLEETRRLDVLTLKTGDYIIMRIKKKSVRVIDKFILERELSEYDVEIVKTIDIEAMKPTINKMILDGNELKGVSVNEIEYLSIKVNPKGKK